MADSGHTLNYQRGGATYRCALYTTTSDVGSNYLGLNIGGTTYYAQLGPANDASSSYLRVYKGGNIYAVLMANNIVSDSGNNGVVDSSGNAVTHS